MLSPRVRDLFRRGLQCVDLSTKVLKHDVKIDRLLADSRVACVKLIEQVKGRISLATQSAEELTDFAASAFEHYTESLLKELLSARAPEAWIRRQFSQELDRAGAALREILAESRYRHTVSQALQRKMFEAESMLRNALKSRFVEAGPAKAAAS
jgi:hypothetical protein